MAAKRYKFARDTLTRDLWELDVNESDHTIARVFSKNVFRLPNKDMTTVRATPDDMPGYYVKPFTGPLRKF